MLGNRKSVYWDANVFLSYVNAMPDHMPVLNALTEQSLNGEITIYTSALSRVEVAFSDSEQQARAPSSEIENQINRFWEDESAITSIEILPALTLSARGMMREGLTRGWSLKPLDAIHLATAQWLIVAGYAIEEFHTYDTSLFKYADVVGCDIVDPYVEQSRLA